MIVDLPSEVNKNLETILKYQQEKSGFYKNPDSFSGEFGDYANSLNLNGIMRVIRARIDKSMSIGEASMISSYRDVESAIREYNDIKMLSREDYYNDAVDEAEQMIAMHKNKTTIVNSRLNGTDPLQRS